MILASSSLLSSAPACSSLFSVSYFCEEPSTLVCFGLFFNAIVFVFWVAVHRQSYQRQRTHHARCRRYSTFFVACWEA